MSIPDPPRPYRHASHLPLFIVRRSFGRFLTFLCTFSLQSLPARQSVCVLFAYALRFGLSRCPVVFQSMPYSMSCCLCLCSVPSQCPVLFLSMPRFVPRSMTCSLRLGALLSPPPSRCRFGALSGSPAVPSRPAGQRCRHGADRSLTHRRRLLLSSITRRLISRACRAAARAGKLHCNEVGRRGCVPVSAVRWFRRSGGRSAVVGRMVSGGHRADSAERGPPPPPGRRSGSD